jgi:hypothetical protein
MNKQESLILIQGIVDFLKRNLEVSLSLEEARNRLEVFSFLNACQLDPSVRKDIGKYARLLTIEQHESFDKLLTEAIGSNGLP